MPRKAAYLRFEDDPSLEWEFLVAEKLGKTVAELRTGKPQPLGHPEFVGWIVYYGRIAQRRELELKKAQSAKRR